SYRGVQDRPDDIRVAIGEHGPIGRTSHVAGEPAGPAPRPLAIARLPRSRPRDHEVAQQAGAYQLRRLVPRARREPGIAGIDEGVEHRPGGCEVWGVAGARIYGEEQVDGLREPEARDVRVRPGGRGRQAAHRLGLAL